MMIANQSVHAHVKENMTCMMENESDATDAHVKGTDAHVKETDAHVTEKETAIYVYMTENTTGAHVNATDAHVCDHHRLLLSLRLWNC
jgi:sarcosine oxidase delta subunit